MTRFNNILFTFNNMKNTKKNFYQFRVLELT